MKQGRKFWALVVLLVLAGGVINFWEVAGEARVSRRPLAEFPTEFAERPEFADMVARMRSQIVSGMVTVLDELRDGPRYAERHVYELTRVDGSTVKREVAIFGAFAEDGRFQHLSETGFDLLADDAR